MKHNDRVPFGRIIRIDNAVRSKIIQHPPQATAGEMPVGAQTGQKDGIAEVREKRPADNQKNKSDGKR